MSDSSLQRLILLRDGLLGIVETTRVINHRLPCPAFGLGSCTDYSWPLESLGGLFVLYFCYLQPIPHKLDTAVLRFELCYRTQTAWDSYDHALGHYSIRYQHVQALALYFFPEICCFTKPNCSYDQYVLVVQIPERSFMTSLLINCLLCLDTL